MTALALHHPAEVETPQERAQRRVEELRRAASGVLEVLAQIYLDEDWRFLHDEAGQTFTGFTQFVQHTLGGSASNARRYRQGVETLVAPLQSITATGTRIPVTPNDVVRLGRTGAQAVLEAAPGALAGVTDSTDQTRALRGLLDEVIAEHHSPDAGQLPADRVLPEIPATVPPAALNRGGEDPWGSDPDTSGPASATDDPLARAATSTPIPDDLDGADYGELRAALDAVLALDPIAAAGEVTSAHSTQLANDCLAGAQRLARVGQLLKALR